MSEKVPNWYIVATELDKLRKEQTAIEWEPEPLYLEIDIPRQQQEQPTPTDDLLIEDVVIIQL